MYNHCDREERGLSSAGRLMEFGRLNLKYSAVLEGDKRLLAHNVSFNVA